MKLLQSKKDWLVHRNINLDKLCLIIHDDTFHFLKWYKLYIIVQLK
jgi:hypothetical protein